MLLAAVVSVPTGLEAFRTEGLRVKDLGLGGGKQEEEEGG